MLLVVGSANADLVVATAKLPSPGETVTDGRFYEAAGGKGANQAVAVARAGGRVAFVGCVGADAFGERAAAGLAAEGIDVRFLKRDASAATGVGLIVVDTRGENQIAVAPGANRSLLEADVDRAFDALRPSAVLVSLEVPLECAWRAIARGADAGAKTILVPAPVPRDEPIGDETLRRVAVLVPNEGEARALGGVEALLARGVGTVVTTRGARGAVVATRGGPPVEVPAFPVEAVDTVGAGDCFAGALAVALSEGRAMPAACRFAAAAAAISVTRRGAQPSMPTRAEIDTLFAPGRR